MIGLVTQVYYARRHGKDPYGSEATEGLSTLADGLGAYKFEKSVELPRTPDAFRVVITECVDDAANLVGRRAVRDLTDMISLFCDFAQYAERTSPDIDVPEFLRQAGLRAASGE